MSELGCRGDVGEITILLQRSIPRYGFWREPDTPEVLNLYGLRRVCGSANLCRRSETRRAVQVHPGARVAR